MRFALLGDHPDGLEVACAMVATGRYELVTYAGPELATEALRRWGIRFTSVSDIEEVLADPSIEAVIVAGPPADRPGQLRRALQSERHVLCVHPADDTPDLAYEAAMIQRDTRCALLPLMAEALHPGILALAELTGAESPLGSVRLFESRRSYRETVLLESDPEQHKPSLPGWDVLRALGGEIVEVSGITVSEHLAANEALILTGRFERGGLFQTSLLPNQAENLWQLTAIGSYAQAQLIFATGWPGPACLRWPDESGVVQERSWEAWNPWPPVVAAFEAAVVASKTAPADAPAPVSPEATTISLTWQTAVRAQELDDAARRSVERRRVSTLEYPEHSEEVGFKGTMTLIGCGLLWLIILLVILAIWFPWLGWAILPILIFFLGLQILRWLVPSEAR